MSDREALEAGWRLYQQKVFDEGASMPVGHDYERGWSDALIYQSSLNTLPGDQGEPTDAEVDAALFAYWGENAKVYGSRNGMRAALRAAGEVSR